MAAPTVTVLVVDDEPVLRRLASRIFGGQGYTVMLAADGLAGLALFDQHRGTIDVVVTDLHMPRLGGNELAWRLRQLEPELPIIVLSGSGRDENDAVLPPGCRVLQKPVTGDLLVEAVETALAASR